MHSTLPSSLARFRQPSRATSKNGLFIALGTMTKRYFAWAKAGLAIITMAAVASNIFLIGFPPRIYAYPEDRLFREADRPRRCWHPPGQYSSNHARAYPIDQHGQDDDHAH